MKIILSLLLFFLPFISIGQDIEYMHYLNVYRKNHNEKKLTWSKNLWLLANNENILNEHNDSITSSIKNKVSVIGYSLPTCNDVQTSFVKFLKDEFKITYAEPKTNHEVAKMVKLYSIFLFSQRPEENKILLGNYTEIGFDFIIKDITYVNNTVIVDGKEIKLDKFIPYYEVKFYFVLNLSK